MKRNESCFLVRSVANLVGILLVGGNALATGPSEKVLYSFAGGTDGSAPFAGLLADAAGNLYGTTANGGTGLCQGGCGTVFELSPHRNGTWTESLLYNFTGGNDGANPETSVIFDHAGNLYGATIAGGTSQNGTIFRLTPAKAGSAWTETVLYNFIGAMDGQVCLGGLVFDGAGNLYGAAMFGGPYGGGTVFQLVPPVRGSAWRLNVLHAFQGIHDGIDPQGALILDAQGAVYGAAHDGTIFKLTPPLQGETKWTFTVLYRVGSVIGIGALLPVMPGVFYGTSSLGGGANAGTVFQLTSRSAATLYEFAGGSDGEFPLNSLIAGISGNLYGASQGGGAFGAGTVFALTPPAKQAGAWTKTTLHDFQGGGDGSGPGAGVIFGPHGVLYGTTVSGGSSNHGTVFEVKP